MFLTNPAPASAQQFDEALFDMLSWQNAGIPRGGRSTGVAGSDTRPLEYYFGAVGGGLWKTTDGGSNWRPVTDGQITSSSVGAVAVCEADPDIVYIGTGETQLRGNVMQGDGVYRSSDAGETWEHLGLVESQNISRIRVHPDNCDVAWVAAFGQHSAEHPERW
ncbi:MAG: glycosyl hydrolase, partial [Gemmatimonadota bacterium]|nr:glycosyl hydrolase [Gemmatimonadota bacterium]